MFKSFLKRLRRLARDESGPTAVEYAVMLALIVIVCLTAIQGVGTNCSTKFQDTARGLDPKTDGNGYSLVLREARDSTPEAWSTPLAWTPSRTLGGTPGSD